MNKINNKGLFCILKDVLKIVELSIKAPISRLEQYRQIASRNYTIIFKHEGNKRVKIPRIALLNILLGRGIAVKRNIMYSHRPKAEVLLRKTVFELYQNGYIDHSHSIIDIGCWISDNTCVWAQFLSEKGYILAIDPNFDNIAYGQKLADLNEIKNIKYVQAVCAEKPGIRLDFDGSMHHTTFNATFKPSASNEYIESNTIDNIIESSKVPIGLFHIDVEGFELQVLKGAKDVIKRDAPVIIFEKHISQENVYEVFNYLKDFDYNVFMINEVVPGSELDCRNFIALPVRKGMPKLSYFEQVECFKLGIHSATIGEALIEV